MCSSALSRSSFDANSFLMQATSIWFWQQKLTPIPVQWLLNAASTFFREREGCKQEEDERMMCMGDKHNTWGIRLGREGDLCSCVGFKVRFKRGQRKVLTGIKDDDEEKGKGTEKRKGASWRKESVRSVLRRPRPGPSVHADTSKHKLLLCFQRGFGGLWGWVVK